jgi:AcrR family transcriptional regulator
MVKIIHDNGYDDGGDVGGMMEEQARSLRDEQKLIARRRLLDAAARVFARRGYHGATVEQIARESGATTGALYSNFAGKEDLFLALLEAKMAAHIEEYAELLRSGETLEQQVRAGADRWMEMLSEDPATFMLLVEFWAYAVREPGTRERFAQALARFREATANRVAAGARQHGFTLPDEAAERLGLFINALGAGLAFEKLAAPQSVPDELFGDVLVLVFRGLIALADEERGPPRPRHP